MENEMPIKFSQISLIGEYRTFQGEHPRKSRTTAIISSGWGKRPELDISASGDDFSEAHFEIAGVLLDRIFEELASHERWSQYIKPEYLDGIKDVQKREHLADIEWSEIHRKSRCYNRDHPKRLRHEEEEKEKKYKMHCLRSWRSRLEERFPDLLPEKAHRLGTPLAKFAEINAEMATLVYQPTDGETK
jgi:hypothetical protein